MPCPASFLIPAGVSCLRKLNRSLTGSQIRIQFLQVVSLSEQTKREGFPCRYARNLSLKTRF